MDHSRVPLSTKPKHQGTVCHYKPEGSKRPISTVPTTKTTRTSQIFAREGKLDADSVTQKRNPIPANRGMPARETCPEITETPSDASNSPKNKAVEQPQAFHSPQHDSSTTDIDKLELIKLAKKLFPDWIFSATNKIPVTQSQRLAVEYVPTFHSSKAWGSEKSKSFADLAKDKTIIGVLDRNDEYGCIPRCQWRWVEAALANIACDMLTGSAGSVIACEDAGWFQGQVKIIACDGERSATLYKMAVSKLGEVYEGAKLEAVSWQDIPSRPRARAWLPVTPGTPKGILNLLKLSNPHLSVECWKVAKLEEPKGPLRQVLFLLTKDSLEALAKTDWVVSYGFSKVAIGIYRSDLKQPSAISCDANEIDLDIEAPDDDLEDLPEGYLTEGAALAAGLNGLDCKEKLSICEMERTGSEEREV